MKPGAYLSSCRNSAMVEPSDVGRLLRLLKVRIVGYTAEELVASIEADLLRASDEELMLFRLCFDFRPGEYRRLCAEADAAEAALTPMIEEAING